MNICLWLMNIKARSSCVTKMDCLFSDMMETFKMSMKDSEAYLTFLHDLSDMGAAMRRVITDVVTNKEIYARLNESKFV